MYFFREEKLLCRSSYLSSLIAFSKHVSDKKLELIKAQIEKSEIAVTPQLKIVGNEAHIYIYGPLVSRPDPYVVLYSYFSTTYQSIQNDIEKVKEDLNVEKVYLHVNSPGGVVEGVDDTWKAIISLRKDYEVIAINEGDMASAAYWLSSAASKIVATSETVETGSIGVIASYVDWSKYDEKVGIQEKIFVSKNAKYKSYTQDGFDEKLQATLDDLEDIFVSRISNGRGLTSEHINAMFGQGSMLLAKDALEAKMIDQIGVFSDKDKPVAVDKQNKLAGVIDNMTLEEMLQDPGVQAEISRKEKDAHKSGRNEALQEVKNAMKFLNSDKYSKRVKDCALSVCEGSKPQAVLDELVSYEDELIAVAASKETEQDKHNVEPLPGKKPDIAGKTERTVEDRVKAIRKQEGKE